jgi:hypothetical protein
VYFSVKPHGCVEDRSPAEAVPLQNGFLAGISFSVRGMFMPPSMWVFPERYAAGWRGGVRVGLGFLF